MKRTEASFLVALVGGSGAGKSFLARQLVALLDGEVTHFSLDNFYLDRSRIPVKERASINYDQPEAIDWELFEQVLQDCKAGHRYQLPAYDFATHTRTEDPTWHTPERLVLVNGLWLLYPSNIRTQFDFSIFLDCSESLRLFRRLARDVGERGRSPDSVRKQFRGMVAPMHKKYVDPQKVRANLVLDETLTPETVASLADRLRALVRSHSLLPDWTCVSFKPELHRCGELGFHRADKFGTTWKSSLPRENRDEEFTENERRHSHV